MPMSSAGGPRALLRRMREIMAERISAQDRLNKLVTVIAANMVAEVCSVYIRRRGGELELFATEGLNPAAVHRTRMKRGEGLVGEIADTGLPLNLVEATAHPQFSHRPETGEDPFHSFLGVPILRGGRTYGVLVVQNRTRRHYDEEEEEALQTVAMVLAEMVAQGQLVDVAELDDTAGKRTGPLRLKGLALADGVAIGKAVLHEPRIRIDKLIAEDVDAERQRLDRAIDAVRESVDRLLDGDDALVTGETRDVLEAYRMFAHDKGWLAKLREAVATGLTAEAAVERVQNDTRARMLRSTDPYLRERLHDLDDLANRLLREIAGVPAPSRGKLPEDVIVVARSMGPAELLDYDRARLRGLMLEEGSPTSHVAIVARALGIPLVGGLQGVTEAVDIEESAVLDGDHGEAHLRPTPEVVDVYRHKIALIRQRAERFASLKDVPSVTSDAVPITLTINAGLLVDLPHLEETGAAGIGLFRTELQFMISAKMPRFAAQTQLYRSVLEAAGERPVVFRTLDLGGDKVLPYAEQAKEENPALGWRAVRIALDRPALLRYQVRALLAAAEGRDLSIMFPMIAEVSEFVAARTLVDREVQRLKRMGKPGPRTLRVGTMLEVPSLAWQLPALLAVSDFVSVGSNDLMQFFFASDRGNPRLVGRYDFLSPPVLRFLRHLAVEAARYNKPLSLCGEAAGKTLEAMTLVGLGFRAMSMAPAAVGPVKQMIRSLNVRRLESYLEELYQRPDHSVRADLLKFAAAEGVTVQG